MKHFLKILILIFFIGTSVSLHAQGPQWIVYNTGNSGLPSNGIASVSVQSDNTIWIGTSALVKYDWNTWTVYDTSNSGLPYPAAYSIQFDKYNNIWLNTIFKGIAKFDGDQNWVVYDTNNSPLHIILWDLNVEDTTVWICTTTK